MRPARASPLCKLGQARIIAGYQCFLLGARPALDLPLGRNGVGDDVEVLAENKNYRSPRRGEPPKCPAWCSATRCSRSARVVPV
jgi:hypothetical protein